MITELHHLDHRIAKLSKSDHKICNSVIKMMQFADQDGANSQLVAVGQFIILFSALWAAWTSMTFYATRFDTDDPFNRLMFLTQMVCIVFYSVFVDKAFAENSQLFAISSSVLCVSIIILYLRIRIALPSVRFIVDKLLGGIILSSSLWLLSIFLPTPYRFYCWIIALCIYFITPLCLRKNLAHNHKNLSSSHLPERFGLFTILVLGESIASVVAGIRVHGLTDASMMTALFSLLLAFGIWWLYFTNIEIDINNKPFMTTILWEFCHFVLVISITALSVAVHHALLSDTTLNLSNALLLGISAGLALLMIALINYIRNGKSPRLNILLSILATFIGVSAYFVEADIAMGFLTDLTVLEIVA